MNAKSAFPAEHHTTLADPSPALLLWDPVVRIGHWLLVASFAGAWLTAESERLRLLHVSFGYTMALVIGFRLLWGVIGSRPARFASFLRGPRAVFDHVAETLRGQPHSVAGHNPLGGWAVLVLLGTGAAIVLSGWMLYNGVGGDAAEDVHEVLAQGLLGLAALHVAGVLGMSLLGRENLVGAMISGRKAIPARDAIAPRRGRFAAAILLALAAAVACLPWIDAGPGAPTISAARGDTGD